MAPRTRLCVEAFGGAASDGRSGRRSRGQARAKEIWHTIGTGERERAVQPEDLGRLFIERANAGGVEGMVALYEPDAVLAFPTGQVTTGSRAIR